MQRIYIISLNVLFIIRIFGMTKMTNRISIRSMQGIPRREHRPCEWALFAPLNDEVTRRLRVIIDKLRK